MAVDDFSRKLYADIYPNKNQYSAAAFMQQVREEYPYTVEYAYSNNSKEYKGTESHALAAQCREAGIGQKFTRCNRPQANGKAERVIRTLMEMWNTQEQFIERKQRQINLLRFKNFYTTVKPHKCNDGMTIYKKLYEHFHGSD